MVGGFLFVVVLVLLALAGGAQAKETEWNHTTGDSLDSVVISADGQYIAAGSFDCRDMLFGRESSSYLWSYASGAGSLVYSVAISADGE